MNKILVSVDGSKNSKQALEKAKRLANLSEGEVLILHVINDTVNNPYLALNDYKKAIDNAFVEQGDIILKEAKDLFSDTDIEVQTLLEHGDPGKVIIDISEKENVDLIIMGSRGLNPLSRMMLGSVSNKVLNNSKTSVLIVK
ncbi:MAG TPA: universal stress protein [Tissierellaceae bacterium]